VFVLGVGGSVLCWWWTRALMLRGEVRWRPLLPTALVTGVGSWAYTLAASLWMPRTLTEPYGQFGSFGIALAFVAWFTGFAFLVTGAAVLGPVLAEGDNAIGRWLRAPQTSPLEPSAAPPLAAPSRLLHLSDAFRLGDKAGHDERPA
jgi:membrane protein